MGEEKRRVSERDRSNANSSSNSTAEKGSESLPRKIYLWCLQCFGKKKSMMVKARKSQTNFYKRFRERCKKKKERRRQKKKATFKEETRVPKTRFEDEVKRTSSEEIDVSDDPRRRKARRRKDRREDRKIDLSEDPWTCERLMREGKVRHEDEVEDMMKEVGDRTIDVPRRSRSRKRRKRGKKEAPTPSVDWLERSEEEDQEEGAVEGIIPDVGIDFTKSCCYLCAKNTMAIAAALSGKADKFHMSIQASTKEILTSDKSVSPSTQVRTVQSSVRVKMRNMGTLVPDKKKSKNMRQRLKIKKFPKIFPKLRRSSYPKVRTVACETIKSMRNNNIPQCRARRGGYCVTATNNET